MTPQPNRLSLARLDSLISSIMADEALRWAIGAYLVARVALTLWSAIVILLAPMQAQNLDLYGAPVLATFDLATSERQVYSRQVGDATLDFRAVARGEVADLQTGSMWSLADGRAVAGKYAGAVLAASRYSTEDVYPYRGVAAEADPLLALWQRFDTNWYLEIAQRGYSPADGSTVYFPLYPALVRLAGGSLLSALLISNLALVGALYLLVRLGASVADAASAKRSVAYVLLFPTGFFLLAAYTESLFLFCALSALFFANRRRWSIAALVGAAAALTRLQGALLVVPLAYMLWRDYEAARRSQGVGISTWIWRAIVLLCIPAATCAFLAWTNLSLLTSYAGDLHARFVWPWENIGASVALLAGGQGSLIDGLNLLATLGLGALVVSVWIKLPREYGLLAAAMYLAPLFRMTTTQPLVSMLRYALEVFPVFWLLGQWGRNPWVQRAVIYPSLALGLYCSAQFFWWGWVG